MGRNVIHGDKKEETYFQFNYTVFFLFSIKKTYFIFPTCLLKKKSMKLIHKWRDRGLNPSQCVGLAISDLLLVELEFVDILYSFLFILKMYQMYDSLNLELISTEDE